MFRDRHVVNVNLQPTHTTRWITDQHTEFVLPGWQRGYVWTEEQAVELLNSMVLGYPIGAFILLEIGCRYSNKLAVLDGQQRITTLRGALLPGAVGEAYPIAYDCLVDRFLVTDTPGPYQIPLPALLNVGDLRQFHWLRESPLWTDEGIKSKAMSNFCEIEESLRNHMSPVYIIGHEATEEVLREVFRRLNTMGSPLEESQIEALFHKADSKK